MKKILVAIAMMAFFCVPMMAAGQEAAPAAETAPAAAEAAPAEADKADPNDPGDVIAGYFNTMSEIVAQNLDTPDALIEKFSAYIKENEKSMRNASKAFDAKLSGLKGADAEVYRETVQRKITPALDKLISQLIEFQSRYPAQAQKLDSLLKVDAKYTYQQ